MNRVRFLSKITLAAGFALAMVSIFSCSSEDGNGCNSSCSFEGTAITIISGNFTDSRDNKTYKTVKIGNQTWMAENLNYAASGSMCYDNQDSNCAIYGRLYAFADKRNVCPDGWHLPNYRELRALLDYVGGIFIAGKHLKAKSGWEDCGTSGSGSSFSCEDTYGFAALPAGLALQNNSFVGIGQEGAWLSDDGYYYLKFIDMDCKTSINDRCGNQCWASIRCVQD